MRSTSGAVRQPMWVRATDGPSNTLVASPNLGVLGFETRTVINLANWTGLECYRGPSDRSGAIREPTHGREGNARPLRQETLEFIGREQGFKDSADHSYLPNFAAASNHAHTNAPQPWDCLGLRLIRDCSEVLTHSERCGWHAAQASMAHDMPRSSCCPDGHV